MNYETHLTRNMKNKKSIVAKLQGIVHSSNVYGNAPGNNGRRYIHPRLVDGTVVLEDLYTGKLWPYAPEVFRTGGGEVITL